jgi:8-oxo-dGTP pyrophosphatase MutT (NUDIX family)
VFPGCAEQLGYLPRQLSNGDTQICFRKNYSGHLTASALLLNRASDAALLIRHKFLDRWLQPGGHLDEFENPLTAAMRELSEETGIAEVRLHQWHSWNAIPIDIDSHSIPRNPGKGEFSHYHHDFLYVLELEHASVDFVLQTDEVSEYKWFQFESLKNGACGKRLARAITKLQGLR